MSAEATIFGLTSLFILLISVVSILSQVFMGLAVYHDARAHGNTNATMWGLLSGLLGWIPAIIYLATRNNVTPVLSCSQCGMQGVHPGFTCPRCGAPPTGFMVSVQDAEMHKSKAKKFLYAMIGAYVAVVVLTIIFMVMFFAAAGTSLREWNYQYNYNWD